MVCVVPYPHKPHSTLCIPEATAIEWCHWKFEILMTQGSRIHEIRCAVALSPTMVGQARETTSYKCDSIAGASSHPSRNR